MPAEQPIIEKLPRISDHLCADCREHFAKLKEELNLRGIAYEENWRLVRGLDYYTRTTFEVTAAGLGSQNAVCGGGRYDGLVELLGGPQHHKGHRLRDRHRPRHLSLQESQISKIAGLGCLHRMDGRQNVSNSRGSRENCANVALTVELSPEEMKFKKSLGLADKLGARYALIIGEDEVASGTYTLKHLAESEQKKLKRKRSPRIS